MVARGRSFHVQGTREAALALYISPSFSPPPAPPPLCSLPFILFLPVVVPFWTDRIEAVVGIVREAEDVSARRLGVHAVRRMQSAGAEALGERALLLCREITPLDPRLLLRRPLLPQQHEAKDGHEQLESTSKIRLQAAAFCCKIEAFDLATAR